MTHITSQIALDATQLAWARLCREGSAETARQRELRRRRLWSGLPLQLGFLLETVVGAVVFASAGCLAPMGPVALVGGLTFWAARRSGAMGTLDQP